MEVQDDEDFSGFVNGVFTEPVERIDAFAPDTLPLTAALNYRPRLSENFSLRLRGGPAVWIPVGDEQEGRDADAFLVYSAQSWFDAGQLRLGGGLSGRWLVTEDGDGDATTHQLGLSASHGLGRVRPGIEFRLPLDKDLTDVVNSVIGLNLQIGI
jgi:hypothetical protein